jgi:hypothetical protein
LTTPIICKSQPLLRTCQRLCSLASVTRGNDLREPVISAKALPVHRLQLPLPAAIICKSQSSLIAANTLPVPQLPFRYPRPCSARTGHRCEGFAGSPAPAYVAGGNDLREPVIAAHTNRTNRAADPPDRFVGLRKSLPRCRQRNQPRPSPFRLSSVTSAHPTGKHAMVATLVEPPSSVTGGHVPPHVNSNAGWTPVDLRIEKALNVSSRSG